MFKQISSILTIFDVIELIMCIISLMELTDFTRIKPNLWNAYYSSYFLEIEEEEEDGLGLRNLCVQMCRRRPQILYFTALSSEYVYDEIVGRSLCFGKKKRRNKKNGFGKDSKTK